MQETPILKLSEPHEFPYYPCPNAAPSLYRGRKFWEVGILGATGSTIVTIVAAGSTVDLKHVTKWEPDERAYVVEVPIPGREGGQVEYLGSPHIDYTVQGICDTSAEVTNVQLLNTIKTSATNATLTLKYGAATPKTATCRVKEYSYWPIAGSTQYWFGYMISLKGIG